MQAIVRDRYGTSDTLELRELDQAEVADDAVLVRVHAASVNPLDWYELRGRPYIARPAYGLLRPRSNRLGADFAGRVEAVGRSLGHLHPGDEVYGVKTGAFAEYVAAPEKRVAPKPANLTFEQAAAVPIAGVTALQALRDKAHVQPGQHVLINGASGGVGTFAVQIAKAFGAEVTGVCSTGNVELVRSIGADHVVDYTSDDFTRSDRRYDLMIDNAGSRAFAECSRVLAPDATVVLVGGPKTNRLLGPLSHVVKTRVASIRKSQRTVFFVADVNPDSLGTLRELIEAGKVTPVIDRRYELSEVPDALRYLGEGHARGKVIITCSPAADA
ncbi:MAG TPA: NAD(P)-dependent alcohol dehydrogenase [Gaiellaceae bacterium]|nr:NAD(P)-dependent alcohol dehydrogenase [Gaiellaceae bacterium]